MSRYAFFFDSTRCTGCKTCELACKDYKDLGTEHTMRRIFDYEGGDWTKGEDGTWTTTSYVYHVSVACNHCDAPACIEACPTGAMHRDPTTDLVLVDAETCIGCGSCAGACSYGAPYIDEVLGCSVKCDGCADRVAAGKQPICVEACPMRALEFGEADVMGAQGEQAALAPLPEPFTGPNFFIKAGPHAQPWDSGDGHVANPLEVV